MRPITREDSFLEFQMNRLIEEIRDLKKILKPELEPEPEPEPELVVKKGRKKRDTISNDFTS